MDTHFTGMSKERLGAGEMAQWLKALTTQPEVNLRHPRGTGWKEHSRKLLSDHQMFAHGGK